ncbi:mucin-3A-like [Dreissena polymorpha]|uniref:Uncharacterized protein n=1 Tax=Dreissena polymorpha TaxID=45954 RepID=A0A9D4MQR7_DREPO|nr:mucin-3A-like [Dreissena polymorpha]XP_052285351.1 mucin-3A-like [Dreissena polymorpha]XP_052285359.1 mucin-3A-like [Dreissena polymorpha]XP_052285365.1 mucin-3A-like [Dreissena polymorpha]XP_052285367.1 mucin-3A-like [Dreissena polymorpha]XP_052285371.1 mucin-3A-like [Dreissena polymorpha]XP_052285375.1 mucin-3A-like [Dreissena polymorpha]KAH3881778.1 hypothetical protein DPMN_005705 [Dreissena polymorpha]
MHSRIVVVVLCLILNDEILLIRANGNGKIGIERAQKTLEIKTYLRHLREPRAAPNTIGGENEHETGNTSSERNNIPNSDASEHGATVDALEAGTNNTSSVLSLTNDTSALTNPTSDSSLPSRGSISSFTQTSSSSTTAILASEILTHIVHTQVITDTTIQSTYIVGSGINILPTSSSVFQDFTKASSSSSDSVINSSETILSTSNPTTTNYVSTSSFSAIQMSFSSYQSQEPQQTPAAPLPDVHSVPSTVPLPATHTISASIVPSFTTTAQSITYSDKTSTLYDKNAKFNETNRTESDGSLLTISPVTGASNATAHSEDATANKEAPGTTPDSRDQLFDASFDGSGDVSSLNFAETTFGTDFTTDDSLKFTSTSFQPPTTATAAATFTTEQSSPSLSSSASQSPSTTVASSPTIHSHITTQPPPTAGTPTSITTEATSTQETHPPLTTTPMADSLPTTANNTASVSTLTHFDINETSVPDGSSSKSTMPSIGESPTSTSAVTSPEHTMLITTAESSPRAHQHSKQL